MRPLSSVRDLRSIGFDDAPFRHVPGVKVRVLGVICAGTRLEGFVSTWVRRDGWNATRALVSSLRGGKFLSQLHLVLLDGLSFGGFNLVDLSALAEALERPCVAVMRRPPRMEAVQRALEKVSFPERRRALLMRAGPVHQRGGFVFQCQGAQAEDVAEALGRLTDRGHVPEPLRLAHLLGGALVTGESGRRA